MPVLSLPVKALPRSVRQSSRPVFSVVSLFASFCFLLFSLPFALIVKNTIHAWSYDYHGMVFFVYVK